MSFYNTITADKFKELHPDGIVQGKKFFIPSYSRPGYYSWINNPNTYGKTFDYWMCSCGKIRSNCGFAKHKCNN
jgi:hypothetical protein